MPTQIKNRRGIKEWYAVWKDPDSGRRKFKKCTSQDDATLVEIGRRKEAALHNLTPSVVTLGGLLLNYQKAAEARGIGMASVQEKATIFAAFGKAMGAGRDVRTVTYGQVERYLGGVAQRVSGDRANRHRIHIVAAWNWGMKAMGLPYPNPWKVDKFKIAPRVRYVPPVGDFWKVVDTAPTEQDKRLLVAFLHTSARLSELLALKWADVDMKGRKLTLMTSKRSGGKEADVVRFTGELESLLTEQRRFVELRSEYVFPAPGGGQLRREYGKQLRFWCVLAKVKPFGFHSIRHLSASLLGEAGLPLKAIQGRLRHQRPTTTDGYMHDLRGHEDAIGEAFARPTEKATTLERDGLSASQCASRFGGPAQ